MEDGLLAGLGFYVQAGDVFEAAREKGGGSVVVAVLEQLRTGKRQKKQKWWD